MPSREAGLDCRFSIVPHGQTSDRPRRPALGTHLGCSQVLAVVNKAAAAPGVRTSFEILTLILWDEQPGVGLLDPMGAVLRAGGGAVRSRCPRCRAQLCRVEMF